MNRIEIFKPGKFVAMDGKTYEFKESDLKQTAAAYDPEKHEAPMVVGHPRGDAPAYGWGKALEFADGALQFVPDQVDPNFAELHRAGRFKKRSASFYAPDDERNPVPGTWYLRHLGFLGAQPPAVKGLKAANFAADDAAVEFGDWNDQSIARILRKMKNFFIEKFGKEEADKVIDEWELEDITREALRPSVPEPTEPDFSETRTEEGAMTPEELRKKEEELKKREASFTEREERIKTQEREALKKKDASFIEGLVKEGKLLPRHKQFAADFLETLSADKGAVEIAVAFSEGQEEKKLDPRAAFCEFLEDLGSHPLFKEMARPASDKEPGQGAEFAENLTACV